MTFTQAQRHVDLQLEQPLSWFDTAIEWVFAAALLFAPLAYGSTNAWSQQVVYSLVFLAAMLLGTKLTFVRGSRFVWTWAYLPIVLYLLLVTLSLIPLPASLVRTISPGTVDEKLKLLADLPDAAQRLARVTITFNSWTTERGLRLVLAMSVVFVVIVNIYRTPAQIKRLLATMAAAGAVVALLALAQDLTHAGGEPYRIYWNIPNISVEAVHPNAGPFAGHSMLGQYMNLSIGAMLALAFMLIGQTFAGDDPNARDVLENLTQPAMRWATILLIGALLSSAALAWSAARGSMTGFAIATFLAAGLLLYKRGARGRETTVSLIVLAGVAVFLYVGYLLVESRLDQLNGDLASGRNVRLAILENMPVLFKTWPVMGSGLESFEWVFPTVYRLPLQNRLYDHAENDYAQTVTDTGLVGTLITASFVTLLIIRLVRLLRRRDAMSLATVGIVFGLAAVMINSASDFSQRTPAVAMMSAVLVGIAFAMPLRPAVVVGNATPRFGWSPLPGGLITVVIAGAMAWSVVSLNGVRKAENLYWSDDPPIPAMPIAQDDPDFSKKVADYFAEPIAGNEQAVTYDPQYVRYPMYLNRYRWRLLAAKRDPKTTAVIYPPGAADVANKIVEEMSAARMLCPGYGRLYTLIGKVQCDLLDRDAGIKNLETARRLWPTDGEAALYLAQAHADRGEWAAAEESARTSDEIDFAFDDDLLDLFTRRYDRPDLLLAAVPDRPYLLNELVNQLQGNLKWAALRTQVLNREVALLEAACARRPGEVGTWLLLGDARLKIEQPAAAADAYKTALALNYEDVELRLKRATLLMELRQFDDARREVNVCLTLRPQMSEATALLAKLDQPGGPR